MSEPRTQQELVRRPSSFPILIFVLCFLFGIWIVPWIALPISYSINRGAEQAKVEAAVDLFKELKSQGIAAPSAAIAPWVVKKVGPAVVGIKTQGVQRGQSEIIDVFGHSYRQERQVLGEGSGIIIDEAGYILTNFHVVGSADKVQIALSDGRTVKEDNVQLVGYDQTTDLAVLKINEKNLHAMEWGDSSAIEVGEPVLAIGNPFGLAHTVTQGIISAKERYRALPDAQMVQEFLQTDAAINPGNSGGPLVNISGELVGVNSAIYGETYQGIGFAIPSVLAKKIYEQIRQTKGELIHGYLGINMDPLSDVYAQKNGIPVGKGVVVSTVQEGTPADTAGLKAGDIILQWGDKEIVGLTHLTHEIILTPPGTEVKVLLVRNGEKLEKTVVVGKRPRI